MPGLRVSAALFFILLMLTPAAYGEGEPPDKNLPKKESNSASLTVVNKSPLPVIGIYMQPAHEAARLAAIGRPNVGNSVYSSDINPGASATVTDIEAGDYVITIVKSNGRGDIIRQVLSPGQTFTYTID